MAQQLVSLRATRLSLISFGRAKESVYARGKRMANPCDQGFLLFQAKMRLIMLDVFTGR
jgi:hypothetical protein